MYLQEDVVLINEQNDVLGTAEKLATHNHNTPLHRGFSVFLFNKQGELLLQQRSKKKKTWPLAWSNSCCGHPMLDETVQEAATRRLHYELGITANVNLQIVLPAYRYRYERYGIVENEICPVLVGVLSQTPQPNSEEVESLAWIRWGDFVKKLKSIPKEYSEWCIEEAALLNKNDVFISFYKNLSNQDDLLQ